MVRKKILLTGSSGYLGSIIFNKLKKKYNVIKYSNQNDLKLDNNNNFAILHLAALDKKSCESNSKLAHKVNVNLTKKIVALGVKKKFKKVIFFSSTHVYGDHKLQCNEKNSLKPTNVYGVTKKKAEECCINFSKKIDIIVFRISNVVAKPIKENKQSKNLLINYLCKRLYKKNVSINSNGLDVRDFVSLNYLMACLNFFLNSKNKGVYNICSGNSIRIKDIAFKIISIFKKKYDLNNKIIFGDIKIDKFDLKFSNKKIKKLVPIQNKHSIYMEIDRIIGGFN